MNLNLARQLLTAADEQPHGFLRVRGFELTREVDELARARLVTKSSGITDGEPWAVIKSVTELGRKFARSLRDVPLPTGQ